MINSINITNWNESMLLAIENIFDEHEKLLDYQSTTTTTSQATHSNQESYIWVKETLPILRKYYLPTILTFGIIGNVLASLVLFRGKIRKTPCGIFMAALALVDLGYLLGLLVSGLVIDGVNLYHVDGPCQIVTFVSHVCTFLSTWFLLALLVDRVLLVLCPKRYLRSTGTTRARITVAVLSVFAVAFYLYCTWMQGVTQDNRCLKLNAFQKEWNVLNIIEMVTLSILPALLFLLMTTYICTKLVTSRSHGSYTLGNSSAIEDDDPFHQSGMKPKVQIHLSKLSLCIAIFHLILVLPTYILRIYITCFLEIKSQEYNTSITWLSFFHYLKNTNCCVNFYIYLVMSRYFRQDFNRTFVDMFYSIAGLCNKVCATCRCNTEITIELQPMATGDSETSSARVSSHKDN